MDNSSSEQGYDYLFKIVIIGDASVGKTSLLRQFCSKTFEEKSSNTVGVDFQVCDIKIGKERQELHVKLQLWDTAGQERFKTFTSVYYRNADAVIIVFDLSQEKTFQSIPEWLTNVQDHCGEVHTILVGNKCDLEPQVNDQEIDDLAYFNNLQFMETSAKNSANVNELFHMIAKDCVEQRNQLLSLESLDSGPGSLWLHQQEALQQHSEGYCCSFI